MEPSQIFGGSAEECQSSESGWTMYIGSPAEDDDIGQSDEYGEENIEGTLQVEAEDQDESDDDDDDDGDSMASDASSGPSHIKSWGDGIKGAGNGLAEEEECVENKYCCLDKDKKANKITTMEEREMEGKKVVEKKKEMNMLFTDGKGKSPVQGGGKVRKNY